MAMVSFSSLLTWPPSKGNPIDIACQPSSFHLSSFRRTGCACAKFFSPIKRRIWHSNLQTNFQSHSNFSTLVPLNSDDSGLICRVIWSIEADLPNGSIIFLTGDPVSLGCWDPDLAIPFSPSSQNTNLYEAKIKVPYGINFKYNYFIRQSSSVIEWRPGPECLLSIPFFTGEDQLIRVKDCWMRNVMKKPPIASWGSWLFNQAYNTDQIIHEASSLGEHEILTSQNGTVSTEDSNSIILKWLSKEEAKQEVINTHPKKGKQKQKEKEKEKMDSTIILVNSSVCTMQRIAVLEEGKLVELLLEPVENTVQCGNIYLGIITRMEPHLGCFFVNIGTQKASLLGGISRNRAPFIFGTVEREEEQREDEGEGVLEEEEREEEIIEGVYEGERETFEEFVEDAEVVDPVHELNKDKKKKGNEMKRKNLWANVKKGTKIIVQVVKEGLGTKGPTLTPYPTLNSRFWVLRTSDRNIGVSSKITGSDKIRLKEFAQMLRPDGFKLVARTVAAGHSLVELRKDLEELLSTWNETMELAKSAAKAADEGVEGAVPVLLQRAMGQTLSVVQNLFNDKVKKMVVDSPHTYHEITRYLQEMAPELCERVELHEKRIPIFDEYKIEEEINGILSKRVPLPNGGSLVIEQTEALVSIDVNSGEIEEGISQEKAALDVNLEAANQIARELRLRDIGGIIVVDFIKMTDDSNKKLLHRELSNAVKQDRSIVNVYELSNLGLMEITRKRVRPSVSFMISDPCMCCRATGRVEALEMSFLKIENEIRQFIAKSNEKPDPKEPKTWPKFGLRVNKHLNEYLTSRNSSKLAVLSVSLNVRISIKLVSAFPRGKFELFPLNDDKKTREKQEAAIEPNNNLICDALIKNLNSLN